MKKLLLAISAFAALNVNAQDYKYCGTDQAMNEWFEKNPSARLVYQTLQQQAKTQDSIAFLNGYKNPEQKMTAAPIYTIPVVFHVLHMGGSENISDAQILDAVNILNRDYQKLNSDTSLVVTQFKNLIGDARVEFRLATKDPSGNCTNGITRHIDPNTNWTSTLSHYIYSWPRNMYMNIYVVKTIASGAAGYTYLPGTSPSLASDAIVILHDYVGSIGTGNAGTSRALTHEVGHWLNLPHVWGGTNNPGVACGDEGVSDTPITKGFSSCPSSTTAAMICNPGIVENYQNYMDYSYCSRMFTTGQATRMNNALLSATAQRNNLSSSGNLTATGVNPTFGPCAPIADFYTYSGVTYNLYTICAGQSLSFVDASYNAAVTSRTWSSTGGATISNVNGSPTTITFPNPGVQTVTLVSSNAQGSSTKTKTVNVLPNAAFITNSYQESFEGTGLPTNWTIINQTGGTTWQQYTGAAASGTKSYYMNNSINPNGAIDIIETPSYDFAANSGAIFTFKYAYARYSTTNADVFKVQASSNCGGTWQDIYTPSNSTLASGSGGTTTTPFFPTPAQFKTYTLTSHPAFNTYKTQSNVRIRFYFQEDPGGGFGNNIFLDDINFNSPLGVNELTKSIGFNVFPNPTSGSASIVFNLSDNADVKYYVTDITGRIVESEKSMNANPGEHILTVNENNSLKSGVYLVHFELNGQKMSRKLIVE